MNRGGGSISPEPENVAWLDPDVMRAMAERAARSYVGDASQQEDNRGTLPQLPIQPRAISSGEDGS